MISKCLNIYLFDLRIVPSCLTDAVLSDVILFLLSQMKGRKHCHVRINALENLKQFTLLLNMMDFTEHWQENKEICIQVLDVKMWTDIDNAISKSSDILH